MQIWKNIKHKLAKWIWRNNQWTKAVDDIEKAAKQIQSGEAEIVVLHWAFRFLPPPNTFEIEVKKGELSKEGDKYA